MPGRLTRLTTLNASGTEAPPRPRLRPRGLPPALEPHGIYAATNPADAALYGQDLLGTHRVHVAPHQVRDFVATFHGVLVRDITLGYLDYSTDVVVDIGALPHHHLVIVPANGSSSISIGTRSVETSPVRAIIPGPGQALRITCPSDTTHLLIRIDHRALGVHLSRLLGRKLDEPIAFDPVFDLVASTASRWNAALQMLHAELYDPESLLHRGSGLGQLEEFVMSSLLYSQPSNYGDELAAPARAERRAVREAKDFIEQNLTSPLTVDDIAGAARVSVRSLQNYFADDVHQTPLAYVRNRRLERAREDLADAASDSRVTVTDVATRWGFNHLGRFATTYKERFGESPSHTLRN